MMLICAGVIRPSMAWSIRRGSCTLTAGMGRCRDIEGSPCWIGRSPPSAIINAICQRMILWQRYGRLRQPRVYPRGSLSRFGPTAGGVHGELGGTGLCGGGVRADDGSVTCRPPVRSVVVVRVPVDGGVGGVVDDRHGPVLHPRPNSLCELFAVGTSDPGQPASMIWGRAGVPLPTPVVWCVWAALAARGDHVAGLIGECDRTR